MKKKIRLSTNDSIALEVTFKNTWLPNDALWIFGSRADLTKKGGDIDLYIETHASTIDDAFVMKQKFLTDLIDKIGEQKIDVVLNMINFSKPLPIHEIAKTEGIKIL